MPQFREQEKTRQRLRLSIENLRLKYGNLQVVWVHPQTRRDIQAMLTSPSDMQWKIGTDSSGPYTACVLFGIDIAVSRDVPVGMLCPFCPADGLPKEEFPVPGEKLTLDEKLFPRRELDVT